MPYSPKGRDHHNMSDSEPKLDDDLTWENTGGNKSWDEMTEVERLRYRLAKRTGALQSAIATIKIIRDERDRLREGVSAFVSDLCLRAEEAQEEGDHEKAEDLWGVAEKWEQLLPKSSPQSSENTKETA